MMQALAVAGVSPERAAAAVEQSLGLACPVAPMAVAQAQAVSTVIAQEVAAQPPSEEEPPVQKWKRPLGC